MTRETEEMLVDFVAHQHRDFDPEKWMEKPHPTGASALERATAAHFLALTTFGHERPLPSWANNKEALLQVAQLLAPNRSLDSKMQETEFLPYRFRGMLNAAVEQHQLQPRLTHARA